MDGGLIHKSFFLSFALYKLHNTRGKSSLLAILHTSLEGTRVKIILARWLL